MTVSDVTTPNPGSVLPVEILESIFAYAGYPSAIELVCKDWLEIVRDRKTTFALLKERKIQFGIEGIIDEKQVEVGKKIEEIQAIFIGRLTPFVLNEKISFFKTRPPTITTLLYLHSLGQDWNVVKCFHAIQKQAGSQLKTPQDLEIGELTVAKQARSIRRILNLKENQAVLQTITEIDLNSLGLTVVPEELDLLRELKSVKLAFNSIRTISSHFGSAWTKLNELHLNNSQIERLPEGFGHAWPELKSIYLFDNKVPFLPQSFGSQWKKVRQVFLQMNKISSLESGFGVTWVELQGIKLSNNLLDKLPGDFGLHWGLLQHFEVCKNHSSIDVEQLKKQWPKIRICK